MWSNFQVATAEDETVFNGFSTNALFNISSDAPARNMPRVNAEVQNHKMVLTIEQSLFLLEDESMTDRSTFLNFSSPIDAMCVSHSGNLVLCALTDGNVHGVHISGVPLFNLCISVDDIGAARTFVGINQLNGVYFLCCTSGRLYRLFNVDEKMMAESLQHDQSACNETILNNVSMERCLSKPFSAGAKPCFSVMASGSGTHVLENGYETLIAGQRLVRWQADTKVERTAAFPSNFAGFQMLLNLEHFVLGLGTDGRLYTVCPYTMLVCNAAAVDYLIDDIVVIECNDQSVELLLLTRCEPATQSRRMLIVDYPSMSAHFELTVAPNAWLIRQAKSSVNMYYLHGVCDANGLVQQIVMNTIAETQPAERLKKLIVRGHLQEAEEFARSHQLDLNAVNEAKARRLVGEIGAIHHHQQDEQNEENHHLRLLQAKFDELRSLARLIADTAFLLSLRTVDIADRTVKRTFLEFLVDSVSPSPTADDAAVFAEIKEQIQRLDTLNLIDPHDCLLEWQRFVYHHNLCDLVMHTFKTDMPTACLIWQHHTAAVLPLRSPQTVAHILAAIPTGTPPFDIILWVRHFLPSIAHSHPAEQRTVAAWCAEKTRMLQHSPHWPEVGLEFASSIREIFAGTRYLLVDDQRQHETTVRQMDDQIRALQDLNVLHDKYKLSLTLDEYKVGTPDEIGAMILGRVALSHLVELVRTFLHPQLFRKRRSLALAVVRYVRFLVQHRKSIALWQERATALVQQLSNETERLECVLLVLKSAPVPWSPVLNPLLAYRTSSHPLAIDIGSQFELQAIKILKTKYGWPADARDDPVKLVNRMCLLQLPEWLADVRTVCELEPQEVRLTIAVTCVLQLVRRQQIEKAGEFVDTLEAEQATRCCGMVLNIVADMQDGRAVLSEGYMDFLASVAERFRGKDELRLKYDRIRRAYTLRERFALAVRVAELADRAKLDGLLQRGIEHILGQAQAAGDADGARPTNSDVVSRCWTETLVLADALDVNRVQAIVRLCDGQTVHFTCAMARWVLELCSPDARTYTHWLDLAALLCAQQVRDLESAASTGDVTLALPVAYRVLQRTVAVNGDVLFDQRELLEWPRVAHDAYGAMEVERFLADLNGLDEMVAQRLCESANAKGAGATNGGVAAAPRRDSMSVFEQVTQAKDVAKTAGGGESAVRCVANAMRLFVALNMAEHELFGRMARVMPIDIDGLEEYENSFVKSLEHLIKSKQHVAAFSVIHQTLRTQKVCAHVVVSVPFASMFHKKALRYALSLKEPDFHNALTMLMADRRPADCLQYLSDELKSGHQKINYLTLVEMHSATLGDRDLFSVNRETRMKYEVYTELCKTDASLRGSVDLDFSSISTLMRQLANKRLDVALLQRMSSYFAWDYEKVLITQIITVLDQQKLEFDVRPTTPRRDSDEIVVRQPASADILRTCAPYIDELPSAQRLADELLAYMEKINIYFYEHYLNVIDVLAYVKHSSPRMELWRSVLLFLKHNMTTKRRQRIGQMETDAWLQTQPDVGVLPHIAYYRFPFWPIVREPLRNLLDDELFVDNCEKWFPLIQLHADLMQKSRADELDHFCMSAVKNSMSELCKMSKDGDGQATGAGAVASNEATGGWCLEPVHNGFLQSILRLTEHIAKRSRKLFCLYFVTNYLPVGADQIDAAHACYRFALENAAEFAADERAQRTCQQIQRKYPLLKTQHLMHVHGLVDERLFQLIEQPREMIEALYGHEAVMRQRPKADINALATEIAELHGLNPREVQISILVKWLAVRSDVGGGDADETFYEDLNVTVAAEETSTTDEDVIKIHYILQSWPPTDAVQWLVAFICADDGVETSQKITAFEVFIKLNKDGSDDTFKDLLTQDQYLALKSVHLLKQLGYNMSAAKFADYDKRLLLRKVWQSHATKPLALELIAIVCHGYGIHSAQIWNGVLKQMVALNMVEQLTVLLETLSAQPALLRLEGLVRAWEHVIQAPFRQANRTRSLEQDRILCRGLRTLQACPVFAKLNVLELARTCVRLQRPHMAAVTVAFAGEEERKEIVEMVRQAAGGGGGGDAGGGGLQKEIEALEEFGIYPVITKEAINALDLA